MKAFYAGSGTDDGAPMDRPVAQIDPVPRVSIQAFCESPDLAAIVSAAISDRRMAKAHIKLNMGGAPAAVEAYKSAPTPNVVVLEAPAGRDALLEQLEELAQYCDAGTKVVVLGKLNDIVLYRQLIARGVSEYLVTPFGVVDFVQAMSQLFSVQGAKPLGRVIAVVGAKGESEHRRSLTIWRGAWPRSPRWPPSSPTSISRSELPDWTTIRTRPRKSPRRCSPRNASTPCWWTGCSPNAATISVSWPRQPRSIASSTLARLRSTRSSTPCGRRRHGS